MKLASALMAADPARAAPVNQVRRLRREVGALLRLFGSLIYYCSWLAVDNLFEIRPEHVEFGFFHVVKVVFLHGEGEEAGSAEGHQQTACKRNPGEFESHAVKRKSGRRSAKG